MKTYLLGLAVAMITAGLLYLAWAKYEDFLYQGRRPPESVTQLLAIEKTGIPNVSFNDLDGKKIELSSYTGKVVLVNFWASWCEPCVKEFPSMMRLIERFKGKIILVAISGDYEKDDIYTFLKAFSVKSPHVIVTWDQDQKLAKQFGTYKLPESYVFGTKGEFIRKIVGVDDWSTPDAFAFFEDLLKPTPNGDSN